MRYTIHSLTLALVMVATFAIGVVQAADTGAKSGVATTTESLAGVSTQTSQRPKAPQAMRGSREEKGHDTGASTGVEDTTNSLVGGKVKR